MAEDSKIGWTDNTWNPWSGCNKVSEGCRDCYIARVMARQRREPFKGPIRQSESTWKQPHSWNRKAAHLGRIKVFTCSHSDFFHQGADDWRDEAWDVIRDCPNLDWLLLTKRPELMIERMPSDWGDGWDHVWLGVSVENKEALSRIPLLKRVPAKIRFISAEPLLERISFRRHLKNIHWMITGCETKWIKTEGRPMDLDWVRDIDQQCRDYDVPHFFKQYFDDLGKYREDGLLDGVAHQDSPESKGVIVVADEQTKRQQAASKTRQKKSAGKNNVPKPAKKSSKKKVSDTKKVKSKTKPSSSTPAVGDPQLDEFQKRCQGVCDLVHHVIHNDDVTGFYLWGGRGCGKTTGISRAFENLGVKPVHFRGTSTAEGLFEAAREAPDGVLWFNDDPRLLTEKSAQQYLLAMLEGSIDPNTGEERRIVTKARAKSTTGSQQFEFKGKLIFDSNVPVGNKPTLQAVQDRMVVNHFSPHDSELGAVLLYLARLEERDPGDQYTLIRLNPRDWKYWEKTTVKERVEVAQHIIGESTVHKRPLTLRILTSTIRYFVDQRDNDLQTDWRDVVAKDITQFDVQFAHTKPPSRKDRLEKDREELQILLEDHEEMGGTTEKRAIQELWMELTGKNQRQFFRRLGELPENMRELYESFPDGRGPK